MKLLTMQQTADYLELAKIEQTLNKGHALIHIGKTLAGVDFVLVSNMNGEMMLTEGM